MKKKVLIGFAVIGASVAVLAGCGSSAKVSAEMDESKRPVFNEKTQAYNFNVEDSKVGFEFSTKWKEENAYSGIYGMAEIDKDTDIYVGYSDEKIGDGSVKAIQDDYNKNIKNETFKNPKSSVTTVKGLDAFYFEFEGNEKEGDDVYNQYRYEVPLRDGFLIIDLKCPYDSSEEAIDKYVDYLDMVTQSLDIPYDLKP